jgi:hypothetical protein
LHITVDEYIPYALWCHEHHESDCLFVDNNGVAFAPAPDLEGGSLYRFFTLGTVPTIQSVLREGQTLTQVVTIAESLETNFLLPVTKIELDAVGDVFFRVVGGGEIKTTLSQTATTTLENLALVLSADEFSAIAPGTFQYIDLRFGNKVFVNDTLPVVATSTDDGVATSSETVMANASVLDEVVQQLADVTNSPGNNPIPDEKPLATASATQGEVGDEEAATSTPVVDTTPATTTEETLEVVE